MEKIFNENFKKVKLLKEIIFKIICLKLSLNLSEYYLNIIDFVAY